jgi:hypothetical protein
MSFPDDTAQEKFIFETRDPLGQLEHLEVTEGQPSAGRNEEDLEIPHKQKSAKSQKQIRKLKKENKLLKKKAKRVVVLKQKVGKLKEIIKELRKQLELADNIHRRKKNKRGRMQGRNPLPKKAVSTTSVGIQTNLEELVVEEAVVQDEDVIPVETQEMVDAEIQTDTLILEETTQLFEQNATIRRLEEELLQSQQTLTQKRDELLTITKQS